MSDFQDLPDLAAGGAALLCNDEFFAEKENLLRPHEAEWKDHLYTDRGKWMDGWETRRRREPGHDWCVVRLGLPGRIRGVVVDTKWFRGNFPESCSLEACTLAGPLDVAQLDGAAWVELLPRSALRGDSRNPFVITDERRFTHVRLNIFPDGGVARLRVHGEPVADWARLRRLGGPVDLAALENGAYVTSCSDMFFGSRHNLIKPGRAVNMSDGWETRRRRGPGNDWALLRLAARGTVRRAEIDTTHFKGNAPGRCTLEGSSGGPDGPWRPLLESRLQPHTVHVFEAELRAVGPVDHVKLSVFPDGGVARLRLWGDLEPAVRLALNGLPRADAVAVLRACCGSSRWAEAMADLRPFEDLAALVRAGDRVWWSLGENDWLEAFSAHPKIGEQRAGAKWSEGEQAGARGAGAAVLDELAELNRAYADTHGFIYIVCATGKSADEMLALLRARAGRDRADELRTAAEEQAKITQLRLAKLIAEEGPA